METEKQIEIEEQTDPLLPTCLDATFFVTVGATDFAF